MPAVNFLYCGFTEAGKYNTGYHVPAERATSVLNAPSIVTCLPLLVICGTLVPDPHPDA